ncbi:MAG TPA: hypothetical protein VGJ92_00025, partial [Methanocella sp.]
MHLANTDTVCAPLRFAVPGHGSLQALSDTPIGSVHCPDASASLRSAALRSGQTLKTSGDRDAAQALA